MGYQALLFCPDEKTARTVTQVLGELEFTVEACSEPFAAVKKLMGEHFDAVVVDCDNEQNATLLFKSARNSTSNQTSLAVAVVEGQAGVAKAFRIGANLVLTKPINIEQTKGTLRVARGLLRKGDPAKPGAAAAAPAPAAAAPAAAPPKPAPKPVAAPRPVAPVTSTSLPPVPRQIPVEKPVATVPAAAATSSVPAAQAAEAKPAAITAAPAMEIPAPASQPVVAHVEKPADVVAPPPAAPFASAHSFSNAGAASAPAPAREPEAPRAVQPVVESAPAPAKIETTSEPAPITGSAPTFSYGSSSNTESSGGNKKIFIGIAAGIVLAIGAYFGWSQLKGHGEASTPNAATQTASAPAQPVKNEVAQPTQVPVTTATTAQPSEPVKASPTSSNAEVNEAPPTPKESVSHPTAKAEKSSTVASGKPAHEEQPEPAPLVVKGGKEPVTSKAANADAAAPSMIGMANPTDVPPTGLVPSTNPTFKPVLQRVSVSQGVSQGLLFKKVPPVYPASALRMRIDGKVELMATISKEGNITQVKVLSGDGQLSKAASDAVKQWKYKPYLLNGEPVEIQTEITVNFKLPN